MLFQSEGKIKSFFVSYLNVLKRKQLFWVHPLEYKPLSKISQILFVWNERVSSSSQSRVLDRLVYDREEFTGHENAAYQDV